MRYTLNAKKAEISKLSKKKDRDKIKRLFDPQREKQIENRKDLIAKIERLNEHFQNRK